MGTVTMALLLAITLLRRVGELHALAIGLPCMGDWLSG